MNSSTSNSKNTPTAFFIAAGLIVLTLVSGTIYLLATDALPAPMITARPSLDEKMRFVRHQSDFSEVDIMAVGSSATFNNLASETLRELSGPSGRYFNFGAWGIKIKHLPAYWAFLNKIHNPKIVVIVGNPYDFVIAEEEELVLNERDLMHYIKGGSSFGYYFKYFNSHYFKRVRDVKHWRESSKTIASLKFDPHGGALLHEDTDDVTPERRNSQFWPNFDPQSYKKLDEFFKELNKKGIKAVYTETPMRDHYLDIADDYKKVEEHWVKIEKIAQKNNMQFLNMHKILDLDDHYFLDHSHLNRPGAILFSQKLVKYIQAHHKLAKE